MAATLAIVGLASCSEPESPTAATKIGLLLPFTGGSAAVGENYESGARMVVDRVNAAGGVATLEAGQLELVTYDTHDDLDRTLDALHQMLEGGVQVVVGPESSELALAILPILQQEEVLFLSPVVSSGTQPEVDAADAWYRFSPSTVVTGRAIAYDALEQGATRMVILSGDDDFHRAIGEEVADRFTREGGEVVAAITLPLRQVTFAAQVSAMLDVDFDAVALVAPPKAAAQVVNEVVFLGEEKRVRYFLPPSLQTEVFLRNTSTEVLEGARGVSASISNFDAAFIEAFRGAADDEPLPGAFFYYDAMTVLSLALATGHHFEFEGSSNRLAPTAEPRDEVPYADLVRLVRKVSERNGIRSTWNEIEDALDLIESGELVFYQGLTGTMVQAADGQRNAAATAIWTIEDGEIRTEGEEAPQERP